MKIFPFLVALMMVAFAHQAQARDEKACFYPANAGVPKLRCYDKEWAVKNGYDLNKAVSIQKRTENPLDSKTCFYPANAGVPAMRCYNTEWAEKNGMDMSKGFMPPRYVASMDADRSTTTECRTQQTNGKPKRVCYNVPKN